MNEQKNLKIHRPHHSQNGDQPHLLVRFHFFKKKLNLVNIFCHKMCLLDANVSPKMCCHLKQQEILCILMQVDIRRCIRSLLEFNLTPTMCALLLYNVNIHILSEKIFSSQIVITQ